MSIVNIILAFIFGLILIILLGRIFLFPLKLIVRFAYNGILGGILLWVTNFFGGFLGMTVGLNPITALIAGFLGIPGVVLLFAAKWLLNH